MQVVLRDRGGRLWVGTQSGLNLLEDAEQGRFRRIQHDPDDRDSLPSDIVNSLAEDRRGRLWVATANGIGVFDPAAEGPARFRRIGTTEGLPQDTVLVLLQDADGNMVAGTGGGLAVIDAGSLAVRSVGPAEGGWIGTYWAGAGARLRDGTLALGGFGGLTLVQPGRLSHWDYRPPVVVTDLRIDGRGVPVGPEITVRPEDHSVQVEFAALDFSAPERNRYAYRLEGADEAWTEATAAHRLAAFANLSPGRYRLLVRGSNSVGVWSEPALAVPVTVLPAWHQTAWFRALAVAAGLLALFGLVRARTAFYRSRAAELTRQVALRTAEVEAERSRAIAGEDEARRAKEEAIAANQAKSRFLAVIGHEIRTPLNGLLGMLQMLEPERLEGEQRHLLTVAKDAGRNLRHLVESVLEYGRHGANAGKVELRDFDLRRLAAEALDLFRPQTESKGVVLDLVVAPAVPGWIRCDRARLERILLNLLGNAVKFTPRGRITLSLAAAPADPAGRIGLRLAVADTGIGITDEMRERIFGDFVQADDSLTRQFGGVGLGLAICRRIADEMGGSLTVDSIPGQGSTFLLTAPVEMGRDAAAPVAAASGDRPRRSVLVVDDDEINRTVAAALLTRLGQDVTTAAGGEAAVDAVASNDFDLVLMDMHMPAVDGIETTRRLRLLSDCGRPLRVVAMTADLTAETAARRMAVGITEILSKPVELDALDRILAALPPRPASSPPASSAGPWLDVQVLARQRDLLGTAETIGVVRLFHRLSRTTIAEMETALAAGDHPQVRALAHKLGSSCGALGLVRLAALLKTIETERAATEHLPARVAALGPARMASLAALREAARDVRAKVLAEIIH